MKLPFRVASIVFLLFTLGHTFGFLSFQPPTPEGRAVLEQMKQVSFGFGSGQATWWNLYKGFGLACSVSMALSTVLCWRLSRPSTDPGLVRSVAWLFCAAQLANIPVSLLYFGVVQAVFTAAAGASLAWAALTVRD